MIPTFSVGNYQTFSYLVQKFERSGMHVECSNFQVFDYSLFHSLIKNKNKKVGLKIFEFHCEVLSAFVTGRTKPGKGSCKRRPQLHMAYVNEAHTRHN